MQLLQLPPELLLHTFEYLGSAFFREDLSRLTISRRWYDFAWPTLVRNLELTSKSLVKFLDNNAIIRHSRPYIAGVSVYLYRPLGAPPAYAIFPRSQDVQSACTLAAVLHQCPGLRRLKLCLEPYCVDDDLMVKPLTDFLSIRHITSLEFDVSGWPAACSRKINVHLCKTINLLLPSLRRLRCRMDWVCERLLRAPEDAKTPLHLEELIVNLSIPELYDNDYIGYIPRHCTWRPGHGTHRSAYNALKATMESAAAAIASRLKGPRMVRVISHVLPSYDISAFDAITGRRMRLGSRCEDDWEIFFQGDGTPGG
ncbi:hypothetical protein N656DRAFT_836830 [Canariomyces notabilis]|uniref:F-box domain-containing protein n=1 Tax=Canariomyces notabilis TaxID=2074819 RepID=A0AAN6TE72_9PEZI|nr:hypothetical protein N656DRAFT_836830 [Canariomyces arenarius]